MHHVSHRLKGVGGKGGVQVVFSAHERMPKMVRKVNTPCTKTGCVTNHTSRFMDCETGVVYRIFFCYVRQKGKCPNALGSESTKQL